jgi:hypothetical protein
VHVGLPLRSILKRPIQLTMEKLETLLKHHDWYYDRSDDMRAWRRGNESNKQIHSAMMELGNTPEVIELYNQHKPY